MKRFLALLLAAALCLCLAACAQEDDSSLPTSKDTAGKVGVICVPSRAAEYAEGKAYGESAIMACRAVGLTTGDLIIKTDISSSNGSFAEEAVRNCIKRGCKIIIGTDTGYTATMKALAAEFKDVSFVQVGDKDAALPNYHGFRVRTYQGAYLCGIAAAMKTKSRKLGVVAPRTADDAEICAMTNAFTLGAQAVNPKITVQLRATGVAESTQKETAAAKALISDGCDVLLQLTKTDAAAQYAAEKKISVCGIYTLLDDTVDTALFSVMPRLTDFFSDMLQALLYNQTSAYDGCYGGFADSLLTTANANADYDETTQTLLDSAQKMMRDGKWDVFSGVSLTVSGTTLTQTPTAVTDNTGAARITAGTALTDTAIHTDMHWLVTGVTVKG